MVIMSVYVDHPTPHKLEAVVVHEEANARF